MIKIGNRVCSLLLIFAVSFLLACGAGNGGGDTTTGTGTDLPATQPADREPADASLDPPETGYGADRLYDFTKGTWLSGSTGDLTVGFLGGTTISASFMRDPYGYVTSGNGFCSSILWMFREMFPNRTVKAYTGARDGSGAGYAAAVFGDTVLRYAPDIVFFEPIDGDSDVGREEIEQGIASVVKQAAGADKIPVLVMVLSAVSSDETDIYGIRAESARIARETAERYGICCIDYQEYLETLFKDSEETRFADFAAPYFITSTRLGGDGQKLFAKAVRERFETEDPVTLLVKFDPEETGTEGSSYLAFGDPRLSFTGTWAHYTGRAPFDPASAESGDLMKIEETDYRYPNHYSGILEGAAGGDSVAFSSSADLLYLRLQTSMRGGLATVTVDGGFWGTVNSNSRERKNIGAKAAENPGNVENTVDCPDTETVRIRLPGDGEAHRVAITLDACEGSHLVFRIGSVTEITEGGRYAQPKKDAVKRPDGKTYAADELLGPDGRFGNDSEGELRISFIGGSLTEGQFYSDPTGACYPYNAWYGANEWTLGFLRYAEDCFPNRTVTAFGAGIGGTGSDFCASRFGFCAADLDADIVFIDSCANDLQLQKDRAESQKYMESIVRQALACEHVPVLIFLTAPVAYAPDHPVTQKWETVAAAKKEIADYYNVGTIDIYEYYKWKYAETGFEGSFLEFLGDWYPSGLSDTGDCYDVHGGYGLYLEAVCKVFTEDPASVVRRIDAPEEGFESNAYRPFWSDYRYLAPNDERIRYEGAWTHLCDYDRNVSDHYDMTGLTDHEISDEHFQFPFTTGDDGYMYTREKAALSLETDADRLLIYAEVSADGNQADVWIDGVKTGQTVDWASMYAHMLYEAEIDLPEDGKTHTVRIETREPENGHCWVCIGYVIEQYRME